MTMRIHSRWIGSGALLLAIVAAALALHSAPTLHAADLPRAADFRLRTLDGETLRLQSLRAKGPVLLDFWATWCKPCVTSLPEVDALSREFGPRGLSVVGISIDGPRNESRLRPFVTRLKLGYPIGLDEDGRLQQTYRVTAVPTAILVDTAGVIVWSRQGYLPGEGAKLRAAIEALLPAAAPDAPTP